MAAPVVARWTAHSQRFEASAATREPAWVKGVLIAVALSFSACSSCAIGDRIRGKYPQAGRFISPRWSEPDALFAIYLTLLVTAIAVPLNLIFGVTRLGRSPSSIFAANSY